MRVGNFKCYKKYAMYTWLKFYFINHSTICYSSSKFLLRNLHVTLLSKVWKNSPILLRYEIPLKRKHLRTEVLIWTDSGCTICSGKVMESRKIVFQISFTWTIQSARMHGMLFDHSAKMLWVVNFYETEKLDRSLSRCEISPNKPRIFYVIGK